MTYRFGEVHSTQDEARRLASAGDAGFAVLVVADHQTSGRGRSGASWTDAPRAMAASLALAPGWEPGDWPRLALVAGLAARLAVADVCRSTVGLKWPNDLTIPAGKVGGILSEASGRLVVVGCGMNLWWADPMDGAAALFAEDPGPEVAIALAVAWADDLVARLDRPAAEWGIDEYRAACVTLGTSIVWDSGSGDAVDIADDGGLVVRTAGGLVVLRSGAVRSVRPASLPGRHRGDEGAAS